MSILKDKKTYIVLFIILFLGCIIFAVVNGEGRSNGIEDFPESYKPYLEELATKHPNWKFTALYTNLDWNYVIDNENEFGKNLVPKNYSDRWKNTKPGEYNVEVDAGWVDSSRQAVEFCMDPRNFLNEVRIFQFEGLSFSEQTNNLDGVEKILYGTEFYNTKVSYVTSTGQTINMSEKYSDLILRGGQTSKVSPYHLASRIKQEVGPFLSHASISGTVSGFEGLYNFYNIGATSSSEPMGAIKNGLQYAKDGKGASEATKTKFLIPWNTKERAITGGAIFIGDSYINQGQDTVYLQKFDVTGSSLFWHQYMTNVLAPYSESKSIYTGYKNSNLLDISMNFIIPIYNNMPDIPTQSPSIEPSNFTDDNTKVYCNATNVNVRTGPSTSYEVITMVQEGNQMTRIKKGIGTGDRWDMVRLSNGIIGYISQNYVTEVPPVQIENIEISLDNNVIQKGETKKLNIKISPEEAKDHKVIYSSSNPNIVTVDSEGNLRGITSGKATITAKAEENNVQATLEVEVYSKVTDILIDNDDVYMQVGDTFKINAYVEPDDTNEKGIIFESNKQDTVTVDEHGNLEAKQEGTAIITVKSKENEGIKKECKVTVVRKMEDSEIHFDSSLNVDSLEISGIDYDKNKVSDLKDLITTDLELEFVNYKGETLGDNDIVGTGSKILVKENGVLLREYTIIVYGDSNGDGKINSVDLLVLQRHILELQKLDSIFIKASNVRKTSSKPSSVDLLLIQRHILGLQEIEQ